MQFLAAPASHNDPLRALSGDELNALTDAQLMHQAFQVLTIDNVGGTLHLDDVLSSLSVSASTNLL